MFGSRGDGARWVGRRRSFELLEERIALSGNAPTVAGIAVSSTEWSPAYISHLGGDLGGYEIPVGSSAQTAALSWKNIDQIKVAFSEDVNIQAADLSLTGKTVTSYAISSFFYDPNTKLATWTLAAPLAKDRLHIDLDANGIDPIKDMDGNVLDGEWANNSDTFASGGDTFAGGDFEFLFNVLPGEVNVTSQVTNLDYVLTRGQEGKSTNSPGYNFKYDVDGSGTIDSVDWQFVQSKISNVLPTGSPAGASNDAPTARPLGPASISDTTANHTIELWSNFGDAESGATGLSYLIESNTASSLFDSISINSTTGQLVLNTKSSVSGVASITIVATDAAGISTRSIVSVGVAYANQRPAILDALAEYVGNGTWRISGEVADDQDVTGLIVVMSGAVNARAAVYPDGSFEVFVQYPDEVYATELLCVTDLLGLDSAETATPIGML